MSEVLRVRVRVSEENTLCVPKAVAEASGIKEGDVVEVRVEGGRVVIESVRNPFDAALNGPKYAKTTFEEFERESEGMQEEFFK